MAWHGIVLEGYGFPAKRDWQDRDGKDREGGKAAERQPRGGCAGDYFARVVYHTYFMFPPELVHARGESEPRDQG